MASDPCELLVRFYSILGRLEREIGGTRRLADCSGQMNWPKRGVYFFQETGEVRTDTGAGPRIVRVGTHALKAGSGTKLWTRLSQHKRRVGHRRGKSQRIDLQAHCWVSANPARRIGLSHLGPWKHSERGDSER
jgi:hypothetical protein